MTNETSNDNDTAYREATLREPDAHGQAAMLLVESLIHGLIARSVIGVADAVEIVEIAAEVKEEVAAELGDSATTMRRSLSILGSLRTSLAIDLDR